jgi:carbon-monoxide dehydrogenase medium subunit
VPAKTFIYHRATDLADAQKVIQQQPQSTNVLLTQPRVPAPYPVTSGLQLDLRNLNLSYIRSKSGQIEIGASTTLQDLADAPLLNNRNNGIVATAALMCTHYGLRNLACAGGAAIASDGPPDLQLAWLILDAQFHWDNGAVAPVGTHPPAGASFPIQISYADTAASAALHAVRRTPRDEAIVAVAAALQIQGSQVTHARIAISGVGNAPARCTAAELVLTDKALTTANITHAAAAAAATPGGRSDYRGSTTYRHAMASVLTQRALEALASN